jgi:hypothetical protein
MRVCAKEAFGDAIESIIRFISKQQGGLFKTGEDGAVSSARALEQSLQLKFNHMKLPAPLTAALQQLSPDVMAK